MVTYEFRQCWTIDFNTKPSYDNAMRSGMYITNYVIVIIFDNELERNILLNCNGIKILIDLYMKQHVYKLSIS